MVLSSSQQVVVAFTAVLCAFVVFPRMFGGGTGSRETTKSFDSRYNRKSPGPGALKGQAFNMDPSSNPGHQGQSVESIKQMRKMVEQEMKSEKYKSSSNNNNKGYVFTLMPMYAIGVGLFAVYKFMKIKAADETQTQKDKLKKGAKKSGETDSQLKELEQRLAQTERMLNSILTQLDPLTNCVKSVAMDQKNEIMAQLQCIRQLMKKRGMECPPLNIEEPACQKNLDELIETLAAQQKVPEPVTVPEQEGETVLEPDCATSELVQTGTETDTDADTEVLKGEEEETSERNEDEEGDESDHSMPSLEDAGDMSVENIGATSQNVPEGSSTGLRRRNRPE
ncbi:coiled-coil domain-containing protein 107 [Clupea harengus]|uniref:Coiled-coil domain-containing protein 107 n=1 Tax=Clupea harengus TaxID=7950 RepID=A0A6P8GT30_CLUHA|nr:coiled-coil domain-containing protein 107 [Clupea harengus]